MLKCPVSKYSRRAPCNAPFEYKVSTTCLADDEHIPSYAQFEMRSATQSASSIFGAFRGNPFKRSTDKSALGGHFSTCSNPPNFEYQFFHS